MKKSALLICLFTSIIALIVAVTGFVQSTPSDPLLDQAVITAPPIDNFIKTRQGVSITDHEEIKEYWLRLHTASSTLYVNETTGMSLRILSEFVLHESRQGSTEIIYAEHPPTGMAFQFQIQPTDIPVDALIIDRLLKAASADPHTTITWYGDNYLYLDPTIPVLMFTVNDQRLGNYDAAWFIRDGYLFQFSLYFPEEEIAKATYNQFISSGIVFPEIANSAWWDND